MKVRSDFITNSSSSSFVIAYRKPTNIDEEAIRKYPILKFYDTAIEAILRAEGYETEESKVFEYQEQYDKYFIDIYGWPMGGNTVDEVLASGDEYVIDVYKMVSDYLKRGYSIATKDIKYGDSLRRLIKDFADGNEDFVILKDDN